MSVLKITAPTTLDKMVELSPLSTSPFDGKKWFIEVVPCADPTCACKNVSLLFRDEHQVNTNQYSYYIEGDLTEERFTTIKFSTYEAELSDLSKPTFLLEEILSKEDWENLITVHRVAKGAFIEDCDLKKVDVDFPLELLKSPSAVVLFKELFPLASYFYFDAKDNIPYAVMDQYCPNHKCNCSDTVLTFTKDGKNEDFAFRYNYKTKVVELLEGFENTVSLEEAKNYIQLLKEKFKNIDEKLEKRNEVMRHLFKKFTIKMNTKLVRVNKGSDQKIGRNAPCPCGSGKKYKRCCG